ncbi:Hypothetical protein POVR1_LOCUS132 [uncultured virus]|nr:Hypothetical protein POVR1_LOCUS132 [uncultured virus]
MDVTKIGPKNVSQLLIEAASTGNLEIMKHFIDDLKFDISASCCECLNAAHDGKHQSVVLYLMSRHEILESDNLGSFLQRVIQTENLGLVTGVITSTKTKPTIEDFEIAIQTGNINIIAEILASTRTQPTIEHLKMAISQNDIHIVKFITQNDYEKEYYKELVRGCIRSTRSFEKIMKNMMVKILPSRFARVSVDGNALLIFCLKNQVLCDQRGKYRIQECIMGIVRHPKFKITRSQELRDLVIQYPKRVYMVVAEERLINNLIANLTTPGG